MHIVVIGAGALGAYFGSRFEEAGANVTFLVREKRAEQIHAHGIHVNSTQGDYTIRNPKVITNTAEVKTVDLVFLSVKGYHLQGTLESLNHLTKKGAHVLPVLNGIEHIRTLQEQLGKEHVVGGLCSIFATLNDKGHVAHSSDFHDLIFGPLEPTQTNICNQLKALTDQANISANYSDDILVDLWKKYMFINAFSGITTAVNLPIGPVTDHPETFHIAEMILQEMKQLANKYNVALTESHVESTKKILLNLNRDGTSSMHQDRRKKQTLEVDHLHGGAVRLAKAVELELPFTEAVLGLIKPFENA
ncbi:2-dehydropantoate 2-reductase [Virgibacillus halotolerans]|uniref:ketopantoate reductase family protein n=1 Tax=Virgibacillus halotolerans TaxID=1071053 RepID=UPI00196055F8|nr:2-dehydropantoate 2-reductase [Virgibacillus halotolerans]MBM7599338.1 2-dehydropantoate 2-reductase [Virgibacillus halotolerans]